MKVSRISGSTTSEVKSIVMIHPTGGARSVRRIYENDDDSDDAIRVRIVKPGTGTVKSLKLVPPGGRGGSSGMLRPIERGVRKLVTREAEIATAYLERHMRSNQRKKNGWVKDLPRNFMRAVKVDD